MVLTLFILHRVVARVDDTPAVRFALKILGVTAVRAIVIQCRWCVSVHVVSDDDRSRCSHLYLCLVPISNWLGEGFLYLDQAAERLRHCAFPKAGTLNRIEALLDFRLQEVLADRNVASYFLYRKVDGPLMGFNQRCAHLLTGLSRP